MNTAAEPRRCARVLVVDEQDRVLLLHSSGYVTPESEFFMTIGGKIEPGESAAEAAVRELFEETGLRADPAALGAPVAHTAGTCWRGFDDHVFFPLRVERFGVDFAHLEASEVGELTGSAWLAVDELRAVDDGVFPVPVADLVKRLVGGDVPAVPVELPWVHWRSEDKRFPLPD